MVSRKMHSLAGSYISKLVFISKPTLLIPVGKKDGELSDNIGKVEKVWCAAHSGKQSLE